LTPPRGENKGLYGDMRNAKALSDTGLSVGEHHRGAINDGKWMKQRALDGKPGVADIIRLKAGKT